MKKANNFQIAKDQSQGVAFIKKTCNGLICEGFKAYFHALVFPITVVRAKILLTKKII